MSFDYEAHICIYFIYIHIHIHNKLKQTSMQGAGPTIGLVVHMS